MAERIQKINPLVEVLAITHHHHPDKGDEIFERATQWAGQAPDAVCDAIDTLIPKVDLLERCIQKGIPVISSMGSASRSDPSQIKILDISKTRVDPFAKAVRLKLKQRGITKGIPCVHSSEVPLDPEQIVLGTEWLCICPNIIKEFGACQHKRYMLGTTSFLPPMFGMWMASYWLRKWVEGVERNLVPEKEYIPTFSEMERAMRAAEWPSEA
jgi:tRNA A37 threonylcarbamoyladenosine dehydratase